MTDRDRLIELNRKAKYYAQEKADERGGLVCIDDEVEYLLANGVIVPPCKVGDIVYAKYSSPHIKQLGVEDVGYYVVGEVIHLGSDNYEFKAYLENEDGYIVDNIEFGAKEIGLTVFLTKEEAEQALKGVKK